LEASPASSGETDLQGKAVWSAARVGEERVDSLPTVHEAGEVAKAVLVPDGLLFALQKHSQRVSGWGLYVLLWDLLN